MLVPMWKLKGLRVGLGGVHYSAIGRRLRVLCVCVCVSVWEIEGEREGKIEIWCIPYCAIRAALYSTVWLGNRSKPFQGCNERLW